MRLSQMSAPRLNNIIAAALIYGAGFAVGLALAWPDVVRLWDAIPKVLQIAVAIPPFGPAIFMSLVFIGSAWAGNLLPIGVFAAGGLVGGAVLLFDTSERRHTA